MLLPSYRGGEGVKRPGVERGNGRWGGGDFFVLHKPDFLKHVVAAAAAVPAAAADERVAALVVLLVVRVARRLRTLRPRRWEVCARRCAPWIGGSEGIGMRALILPPS